GVCGVPPLTAEQWRDVPFLRGRGVRGAAAVVLAPSLLLLALEHVRTFTHFEPSHACVVLISRHAVICRLDNRNLRGCGVVIILVKVAPGQVVLERSSGPTSMHSWVG
ncbi:hypothetical protein HAX54_007365, partial [Datura stramonium]|nr:hypothetical protein [Datura stramonium]